MGALRSVVAWWRQFAVSALAVTCATGCTLGVQDFPLSGVGKTFDVVAEFATAGGVVHGSDVRSGQRVVGRVTRIDLVSGRADLTLSIDDGTQLPANVRAEVQLPSALGTPFVRLSAPQHPHGRLVGGGRIAIAQNVVGPQIESMLAALGNVLTGSGITQLESVIASLNQAFASRSEKVGALIDTLSRLLDRSSRYTSDFTRAMAAAADVTDALTSQQKLVEKFLDTTPEAMKVLVAQRNRLTQLIDQTTSLGRTTDALVRGRQSTLNGLVGDARAMVDALGTFNDDVGSTLTHMNQFMTNFNRSVRGDYLVFDGALDIPGGIDKILSGGMLLSGNPLPAPGDLRDALTGGLAASGGR